MLIIVGLYGAIDCSWGAQEAALERARRQAFRGAAAEVYRFISPKKVGSWSKKLWKIVKVEIHSTKSCEHWGFNWFNPEKPCEK